MPKNRRQIIRRRWATLITVLVVVIAGTVYSSTMLSAALPATAAAMEEQTPITPAAAQLVWPDYGRGAISAVGYDGLLGSSGDQTAAPMASITKLITALVVLKAKPIAVGTEGPTITYTARDVDIYYQELAKNASVAPVIPGLAISEKQSLSAMLVPSAANYSVSLAEWAYGSVDAYLAAARAWLQDNGLNDTRIADTSGLSDASVSTPADLVALGKIANADATIHEITAQATVTIPGIGTLENTNKLLGTDGFVGLKTGTKDSSGACLLFSVDFAVGGQNLTLIGVLLGGPTVRSHATLDASIQALVASTKAGFHEVPLVAKGDEFASYTTLWGDSATAVASEDASVLTWSDTPVTRVVSVKPVTIADTGATVGSVDFAAGGQKVSVPLLLDGTLTDPGTMWRLGNATALVG